MYVLFNKIWLTYSLKVPCFYTIKFQKMMYNEFSYYQLYMRVICLFTYNILLPVLTYTVTRCPSPGVWHCFSRSPHYKCVVPLSYSLNGDDITWPCLYIISVLSPLSIPLMVFNSFQWINIISMLWLQYSPVTPLHPSEWPWWSLHRFSLRH